MKTDWQAYGTVSKIRWALGPADRLMLRLMWKITTDYNRYVYVGLKDGLQIKVGDFIRIAPKSRVSKILEWRRQAVKAVRGKSLPKESSLIEEGRLSYVREEIP